VPKLPEVEGEGYEDDVDPDIGGGMAQLWAGRERRRS